MSSPELAAAPRAPSPRYRWEVVPDESLALIGPCGIVWQLNFSPRLTKPHFHPLQTSDGTLLTWVAPPDHRWHYGLWHSWKFIDGVNYWEEDPKTGRAAGTTRTVAADILRTDEKGAAVRLRLQYHPADQPDAVLVDDIIELTMDLPGADGSYRIAWRQETAARRAVVLDRTPLPPEPEGKGWGGYAGLGLRASPYLRAVGMINSEGARDMTVHRAPARWAAMLGTTDGRPAGVTFLDHPANPRHPPPWFVVQTPKQPFWYLATGFLFNGSFVLQPGQPLVRRYLVRIDRIHPAPATLEAEFRRFAAAT